ncbi:MAG TPA: arginase, partial [Croceibacterium sp.]|nr:arginase [Croceibacterium sp.]
MTSMSAFAGWTMALAAAATSLVVSDLDTPNPPPPIPEEDIMGKPRPLELPDDVKAKLSLVPAEQLAFIEGGLSGRFVDKDTLFERARTMPEAELVAYIGAIYALYDQSEYKEGRDSATIPLDTSSPMFNAWKLRRPLALDPAREAGPVELGRYIGGRGGGFSTFAGAPLAFTPEDLIAGKVDVAIVGAPLDMGSGWRNAIDGPR